MKKILLAALLALPLVAQAQYPSKPVRAVVAFGTGGTTDVTARIVAGALSQSLGQTVVIDNKPGADGIIAGTDVAKSAPDGYTIWFATYTQISALPSLRKNVPFDTAADFTPTGNIGNFSFFWAVNPDLPINSLKELAAYSNLLLAGRCGRFWYNNMDHSIGQGLTMADKILQGSRLSEIDSADREFWEADAEPDTPPQPEPLVANAGR